MATPIISVEHLSKRYRIRHEQTPRYTALRDVLTERVQGLFRRRAPRVTTEEFLALDDVSFTVAPGDRVGIIGRNGAGKSTLLKVLSRITEPSAGRVVLEGRVASLLEVGTGFHPELSGRENIFLNGSILGMGRAEIAGKFDEIVAFAEVERFLDTPVKRYSSGMYVRLAFAVAAHLEPEILIVDEVLAVGDAAFQRKCLGKMESVAGAGRTVLFVSHNMDAVQRLCNKGVLLHRGKLLAEGPMPQVVDQYLLSATTGASRTQFTLTTEQLAQPAVATALTLEDPDGRPVNEVPIGAPWQARISFQVNKQVEDLVVGLGLATLMDFPVRTTWSPPQALPPGRFEAVFHSDGIALSDGTYKFVVGIDIGRRNRHFVPEAGHLTISDATTLQDDVRIVNSKSGLIMNQLEVTILPASS